MKILILILDKKHDYDESNEQLKKSGGYLLQATGLLNSKVPISLDESIDILSCFSAFFSFINGSKTSAMFITGKHEGNEVFKNLYCDGIDQYIYHFNWTNHKSLKKLQPCWPKFYKLWFKSNFNYLKILIHWYTEANKVTGLKDGAIVIVQIALELLFNIYFIEDKQILKIEDSERLNAGAKIRLLLNEIKIENGLVDKYSQLKEFIKQNRSNEFYDFIDVIVFVRNCIAHSDIKKRDKFIKISEEVKFDCLEISLQIIELLILKLIDFNGEIEFRCGCGDEDEQLTGYVPWHLSSV